MRAKRIVVSPDVLRAAIGLPLNATVASARQTDRYGDIELLVICEDFEAVKEGERLPITSPQITAIHKDCGCTEYKWKWGSET